MGKGFKQAFSEIWDNIRPVFDAAETGRRAVDVREIPLTVERSGYMEETYFTGNFNPLRLEDGTVGGFYNALTEVTRQILADRRMEMLNLISAPAAKYSYQTITSHILSSFRTNSRDVPLALLYGVDEDCPLDNVRLTLKGSIGVPDKHPLAVRHIRLDSEQGLVPLFRKSQSGVVTVPTGNEFEGVEWLGHGEPSKYIAVLSLSNAGRLFGFLLLGTNPQRPIDNDHDQFMNDLSRQVSFTIAFTVSMEESMKRRLSLQNQLADSERHIRYMAEHLDIGMEHLTLDGKIIWANEHFYKLVHRDYLDTGDELLPLASEVLPEDRSIIDDGWRRVVQGEKIRTMELRIRRTFQPPYGGPVPSTIILSAFPYIEEGEIQSVMACMTDVSRLKWAESWQARAAQEAQEAKRQQSEFTDAISHEVRNPLSAIFQLADTIAKSSEGLEQQNMSVLDWMRIVDDNIEAANTILLCANHQKRIVDDVLTLSKMDFMLMTLNPTAVRPLDIVDGTLKIVEADLSSGQITLELVPESSLDRLGVSWVLCDSLRVTQILINLLSNAIKFTKREERRIIRLRYGACLSDPQQSLPQNILWATQNDSIQTEEDVTAGEEWGPGEAVYLTFTISDTGPGMSKDELLILFNRFQQANPRTSIKYGGSGLGLFISRVLSAKQNGSIGVASKEGQGSTFAFYIKARRWDSGYLSPMDINESPLEMLRPTDHEAADEIQGLEAGIASIPLLSALPNTSHTYHILLVEDNIVNQKILLRQLTRAGCVVHVANHGVEALAILKTTSFWARKEETGIRLDIVLMDWEMPIMDGLTCSREIRSLERSGQINKHVEIIAITANVRREQIDRALSAGIDAVVPKPFVVSDLLKAIGNRLGW